MDKLPDEILLHIFELLLPNVEQLRILSQVSTVFFRIVQEPKLWYLCFVEHYSAWASRVEYRQRLIDWQDFVIHLAKQQKTTQHFTFDFVEEVQQCKKRKLSSCTDDKDDSDNDVFENNSKHVKTESGNNGLRLVGREYQPGKQQQQQQQQVEKPPFWIQDPLVIDIDRITKTGVVATGKHRKNVDCVYPRSEHKILFWEYPSWRLIRTFELNLTPQSFTCQIIGIQSIRMPTAGGTQKVRFFSLAVGTLMDQGVEPDIEDRVDIWKAVFIYRLNDNGSTQCVAHFKTNDFFLGREVFLFSDTSWAQSNDGDDNENDIDHDNDHDNGSNQVTTDKLHDWMKIVSPANADDDPRYTVYIIAIGPILDSITGCVQLAKFDIRGQKDILDPSICPTTWDYMNDHLRYKYDLENLSFQNYAPPTYMITTIKLGTEVSCMIHFKYPPHLNHLICTGSYRDDELSVYDWRFGIKVGNLPWKSIEQSSPLPQSPRIDDQSFLLQQQQNGINTDPELIDLQANNDMEDEDMLDDRIEARPWGLESTLVVPPHWSNTITSSQNLAQRGFRLIAVGDNRADSTKDKLEIKVWDISYLLQVKWNPLKEINTQGKKNETEIADLSHKFAWWRRGTKYLQRLATQMVNEERKKNTQNRRNTININHNHASQKSIRLPYSPPPGFQSMILAHTFDKEEDKGSDIPVKYTAYNVLYTSLFLLTEDGRITVMDIETGKVTGTVENVAASSIEIGPQRQVRGIDVNVIGGREVVVTSKEGLLRGVVS